MENSWSDQDKIDRLEKGLFGEELMTKVAQQLVKQSDVPYSKVTLLQSHREYCGHGLVYEHGEYKLCAIYDGTPRDLIKSWKNEKSFVDFWEKQSDFSCSGADKTQKVFHTGSKFSLNNQRLTRIKFVKYASK